MPATVDELYEAALGLSAEGRAKLVRRIIGSLDDDANEDPVAAAEAWEEELDRRVEAYHAGKLTTTPAEEVFASLRRQKSP